MSRLFYHVMQDNVGNLLFDVSGTMRLAGTGTAATIYGDEALTVPIANPMTNHPSFGSFKCFLGAGDYDFYMAKAGYTFETLTGVQGHGSMAQQDAGAVAITGGNVACTTLDVTGLAGFQGPIGIQIAPATPTASCYLYFVRNTQAGLYVRPSLDTGNVNVQFVNAANTPVGNINTNGSSTAYNTTSDARLKHAITPLAGALDVVRALNPVSFLWKANGSPGRGLLAGEVQDVIPDGVITGERGAIDDEGRILPQMIDYSKLVPYLIGAVKELTEQVEALTAQLAAADG